MSSDLWHEAKQLVTADFLRELVAAWLAVGAVGVLLFIA
jgi:hypothetical protein